MRPASPALLFLALCVSCSGGGPAGGSSSSSGGQVAASSSGAGASSLGSSGGGAGTSGSAGASSHTASSGLASSAASGSPASSSARSSSSVPSGGSSGGGLTVTTLFTIVLENHDYEEIVGSANAPYINSLIAQGGLATNYMDSGTHPSLPNYLYMISGATQYPGIIDLDPTAAFLSPFPVDADNLGNQLQVAGLTWRSYQESMGTPCLLSSNNNHYAPKHDPFLYFQNIQNNAALCAQTSVDYTAFAADLAAGSYRYMFITPNLLSDGHDPTTDPVAGLQQSDAWLQANVPAILNSATYQAGGILFITWDEAEGRNGHSQHQVPMIILSPHLVNAGFTSNHAYSHASYLATVEHILGLPLLGAAATADPMMEFFH